MSVSRMRMNPSSWKSSSATIYVLTLTPTTAAGSTGTVTIDVAAGVATDAANNDNEAATRASVSVDKERSYGFINKWCSEW